MTANEFAARAGDAGNIADAWSVCHGFEPQVFRRDDGFVSVLAKDSLHHN